jgi:Cu-Zn family superoxide dismutase
VRRWSHPRHVAAGLIVCAVGIFVASPAIAGKDRVSATGDLVRYRPTVPSAASATVLATYDTMGDSTITLRVSGLEPNTEYGAHAHVDACGATPRAAGPHFQHTPNPYPQNPHDPVYVNSVNEIWLDFTTDDRGTGSSTTELGWQFEPQRRAGSVMIHAHRTQLGGRDGVAGTAGAALACLTVGF